jgi:hypothetical protein
MKRSLPGFAAAGTLFLAMFATELAFDTESIRALSSALRGDSIECREVILYAVFARLSRCGQPVDC